MRKIMVMVMVFFILTSCQIDNQVGVNDKVIVETISLEINSGKCLPIIQQIDYLNSFNILIMGIDYNQEHQVDYPEPNKYGATYSFSGSFTEDLKKFKSGLEFQQGDDDFLSTSTNFFSQIKDKTNIFVLKTDRNILENDQWCCNKDALIDEIEKKCSQPIDFVIIFQNKEEFGAIPPHAKEDIGAYITYRYGNDYYPNHTMVSSLAAGGIDLHEFGHGFIGMKHTSISPERNPDFFGQQESTDYNYSSSVDSDIIGCPKWCSGEINTAALCYPYYSGFVSCNQQITNTIVYLDNGKITYPDKNENKKCWEEWNSRSIAETGISLAYCDLGVGCMENTGCFFMKDSIYNWRENIGDAMGSPQVGLSNTKLSSSQASLSYGGYTKKKMLDKVDAIMLYHQETGKGFVQK